MNDPLGSFAEFFQQAKAAETGCTLIEDERSGSETIHV